MYSHLCKAANAATFLLLALIAPTMAPAQTYTVLYTIHGNQYAAGPLWGVLQDPEGNLYGTTSGGGETGLGTIFKINANGDESLIYNFKTIADGESPASLIRDTNGNFFGNTYYGGNAFYSFGTVYKLSSTGEETVLHTFEGKADGAYPQSPLAQDAAGNLYGAAFSYGGANSAGTVFRITPDGRFSLLHTFAGGTADGCRPAAGLIFVADVLYGTTAGCGTYGYGTIFAISKTGEYVVLYNFGKGDGDSPLALLMIDAQGNLYGTTGGNYGCGTVFKFSAVGQFTTLHTFSGGLSDGCDPTSGLVEDARGNLYGTTQFGGKLGFGTVFKVTADGKESVLHNFGGGVKGGLPPAGLTEDAAGNLYGTTEYGGQLLCGSASDNYGCGVVFKITP